MNLTSFLQDKRLTIILKGEIDHHMAKEIMQKISEKIDDYLPTACILDYKNVTFMDSSGIAIVIHTYRRMKELGGTLKLKQVPMQPWKVLHAAGIDRIIETERSENAYEM